MSASISGRVLIFIPTFNDHEHLPRLCQEVSALSDVLDILIVDDGSDKPIDLALLPRVLQFRMPENFGLGACTHVAFDHALRHDYRAVVRVDGDGQHQVADILRIIDSLNDADVVVAGRVNRRQYRGLRGFMTWAVTAYYSTLARILTKGKAPSDVNTGFFGVAQRGIEVLNQSPLERFPEPQMFIIACRRGLEVEEIDTEQWPRSHGESTLSVQQAIRMFYRFNLFVLTECLYGARDR